MLTINDQELEWLQLLNGDTASFDKIMQAFINPLSVYGWRFTRDKHLIKDVIQELFLVIWQKREKLSKNICLQPYLYASFRRLLIRKLREQEKKNLILQDDFKEENFQLSITISRELMEKEQALAWESQLNKFIQELPARQREVIYLRFFQGLRREEVAQIMEISSQTVSNIQQMAIRTLRDAFPSIYSTMNILLIFKDIEMLN
jgi:RNA polymerase sigma factor (sigma-70 family)